MRMPEPQLQRQTEPEEQQEGMNAPAGRGHEVISDYFGDGGQPLSQFERQFFEPRFGHDFSQVRLHLSPAAASLNDTLHSHAFTHGQHIWLGRGKSSTNMRLIAHELAHTIQQGAVPRLDRLFSERLPATSPMLATQHTPPTGIQRSVQKTGVRSPRTVLQRIGLTLLKNSSLPIPLQLYYLANEFHPGEGVDDPRNAFVYTCRGGWIDMGHFFFTAAGASTFVYRWKTWRRALETEEEQQRERKKFETMPLSEREKYFGRSWQEATPKQLAKRGSAWSAYTIEDLPSDKFGFDFGKSILPLANIYLRVVEFFDRVGAVDASRNKELLERMMVETLGTGDPGKLPRQHRTTDPVLLESGRGLCSQS